MSRRRQPHHRKSAFLFQLRGAYSPWSAKAAALTRRVSVAGAQQWISAHPPARAGRQLAWTDGAALRDSDLLLTHLIHTSLAERV